MLQHTYVLFNFLFKINKERPGDIGRGTLQRQSSTDLWCKIVPLTNLGKQNPLAACLWILYNHK